MIRCNLSILMAERGLKVTTVSKETGLSRTTLTALVNNRSTGIQLDTVEILCKYLKVSPDQLIGFVAADVKIIGVKLIEEVPISTINGATIQYNEILSFEFSSGWDVPAEICRAQSITTVTKEYDGAYNADVLTARLELSPFSLDEEAQAVEHLQNILSTIPRPFLTDIENEISYTHTAVSSPIGQLPSKSEFTKIRYQVYWNKEFAPHTEYRKLTPEEMNRLYPR